MTENITIRLSGKPNSQPIKRLADWLYAGLSGCADGYMINGMIDRMDSRKTGCSNIQTVKHSNVQTASQSIILSTDQLALCPAIRLVVRSVK